jgi:hypothetical protein
MKVRDRIKAFRRVAAKELLPNPKNWRTHPKSQQDALRGVLAEVGVADACIARELPDGTLMLIDGHLRAETLGDGKVPVLILDVTEEEADKLLATLDPLAAMADTDSDRLEELLKGVATDSDALQQMIEATAASAGLYQELDSPPEPPEENAGSGEGGDPAGDDDGDSPAGVRMVQLFLDEQTIVAFQENCTKLAAAYGTANVTDTVMEAVRRESASL